MNCRRRLTIPIVAISLFLGACQGGVYTTGGTAGDTGGLTACEWAMKTAADIDSMNDAVTDLDPAIQQCESIDEFEHGARKFGRSARRPVDH